MSKKISKSKSKSVITDFRVIAVSGVTADGREITSQSIIEMAEQYDPDLYNARVNLEHLHFVIPNDEVGGFGDVVELKAQQRADGKYALLARLRVNENLQAVWDSDQKVYSSIEMITKFADTGKAYLVGLAVTDTPSSLCTTRHFVRAAEKNISNFCCMDVDLDPENKKQSGDPKTISALSNAFGAILQKFGKTVEPKEVAPDINNNNTNTNTEIVKLQQQIDDLVVLMSKQAAVCEEFSRQLSALQNEPVTADRSPHMGGRSEFRAEF